MRNRRVWIGALVSLFFLYLAFRNVQWRDVWAAWQSVQLPLFALGVFLQVFIWLISAVRWRLLLMSIDGLRVRDTFAYIAIGYFANSVLPLRLGELARATLIGRNRGVGVGRALGSIVLERTLDLAVLIGITFAVAQVVDLSPAIRESAKALALTGFCVLAGLVFLAFHVERLPALIAWSTRLLPHRLVERLTVFVQNVATGAEVVRSPGAFLCALGLSVGFWGVAGLMTLVWIRSFHLPVPWFGAYFVLVMINFGSAIPSSPGFIGVYHYLAVLALSPYVPERDMALAYALGTHAAIMLVNWTVGGWFLSREGIDLRGLKMVQDMASPSRGSSE